MNICYDAIFHVIYLLQIPIMKNPDKYEFVCFFDIDAFILI